MNAMTESANYLRSECVSDFLEKDSNFELESLKTKLLSHELYGAVTNTRALQRFMEAHVFAVWDFMSLAKSLQNSLTCTQLPWFPPVDSSSARFVNEIILNEESDLTREGKPQSHLEMYLDAMKEVGASTGAFDTFSVLVKSGLNVEEALSGAGVPEYVAGFVNTTLGIAIHGSVVEVASFFLYGREDPIPEMFKALIGRWDVQNASVDKLRWYLDRHIELDGDEHGPAAHQLLKQLTNDDTVKLRSAQRAALDAVQSRIALWDGILDDIKRL